MSKKKRSSKHSIRSWLLFPYLLILLLALVMVGSFLIYTSVNNSKLILADLKEHMIRHVNEDIKQSLALAEQLNRINSDMFKAGNLKIEAQDEREIYFTNILKSYPQAAMSFIGLPDGSFYGARKNLDGKKFIVRNDASTNGGSYYFSTDEFGVGTTLEEKYPDFDPRTRPWYQAAEEAGEAVYSSVYLHFVFNEPTITASAPIYSDDGELIGVFGVNYLLSWMDTLLKKLYIGKNGVIYIVDEVGNLLSTNVDVDLYRLEEDELSLINIDQVDNKYISKSKDIHQIENAREDISVRIEGKKYYVNKANINHKNIDWEVIFLIAEDDFLWNIKKASLYTVVFLGIVILLATRITFLVAEKIGRPIEELSKAGEKIFSNSFEPILKERKIIEIDSLTESLNKSGKALAMQLADLEKEVLDRTKELEEKNELLENLSYYDGLTGVFNRRKFDEYYSKAWNSAIRNGTSLGIVMIDIDYFKKYNDSYGHIKGDEALRDIAQNLQENLRRSTDFLARYGGEEFIVLVEGIEEKELESLAEKLRQTIEDLRIKREVREFKYLTISLGYSCVVPSTNLDRTKLIKRADKGLYKAKAAGKNQVFKG